MFCHPGPSLEERRGLQAYWASVMGPGSFTDARTEQNNIYPPLILGRGRPYPRVDSEFRVPLSFDMD